MKAKLRIGRLCRELAAGLGGVVVEPVGAGDAVPARPLRGIQSGVGAPEQAGGGFTAAAVGLAVYVGNIILSFFLPEPGLDEEHE